MIKLEILNINNYDYELLSEEGNKYILNIGFIDVECLPQVGDYIYVYEELLKDKNIYTFGPIYNSKGKDIIKITTDNVEYYLQRYYG